MKSFFFLLIFTAFNCYAAENLYVGTSGKSGIFILDFNDETGKLTKLFQKKDTVSPGFFTFSHDKKFLYVAASGNDIRAYKIEKDGQLTFINKKRSSGQGSCHIEISKSAKAVVVANFSTGSASVVSIGSDGSLTGEARDHSHNEFPRPGKHGVQKIARAHNVKMSPDGKYAFVCDLGADKIIIYKFDDNYEKLTLTDHKYVDVPPSSGPRHFTFHPNGKFAYVINELSSTVSAFHYKGEGKLEIKETVTTKPAGYKGYNNCADIHVHPNGRFLYGSNRGHNSIVIYKINQQDGSLSLVGHESSGGNWPRNFTLSPSGDHLLVANKRSHEINVFKINKETGKLTSVGESFQLKELKAPICLKFINSELLTSGKIK